MHSIGAKLREYWRKAGYTSARELAEKIPIQERRLQAIAGDRELPNINEIRILCKHLGISSDAWILDIWSPPSEMCAKYIKLSPHHQRMVADGMGMFEKLEAFEAFQGASGCKVCEELKKL